MTAGDPYDELHREWVATFAGYDLVQEQGVSERWQWRRATQPELDSIAILATAREKRVHGGDTCVGVEGRLDEVRRLREDRDRLRRLVAADEGIRVAHARHEDATELSEACGVEPGVLHWHELIERVAALRALVEPDAQETS